MDTGLSGWAIARLLYLAALAGAAAAAGAAATTVRGTVEPGAEGVWIFISRPDAFRQAPAEFYTTDFIADV